MGYANGLKPLDEMTEEELLKLLTWYGTLSRVRNQLIRAAHNRGIKKAEISRRTKMSYSRVKDIVYGHKLTQ